MMTRSPKGCTPETVRTTKRDAFRRAGVHSMAEFIAKLKDKI